ncbi:MAG: hypothetical protein ACR2MQ_15770 [Gemmatimonadaceae bacterium]
MTTEPDRSSRRDFVTDVGRLASVVALTACVNPRHAPRPGQLLAPPSTHAAAPAGKWDLSWIDRLATATDRAVFDWPAMEDPEDSTTLDHAARYLDNCEAAYEPGTYEARVVLTIRARAVPTALTDAAWQHHALGVEYNVKDPVTHQPAVRNPFWHRAPGPITAVTPPTLEDLVRRGAIVLVCDFALGHLAKRLATKSGRDVDEVRRELRGEFVPNSFAVPSGIFGLVRAQNAGCAYVRA